MNYAQSSPDLRPERTATIVDTGISSMVQQVSADSIRAYVTKLAGFGTRHSLSDTLDSRGSVGAEGHRSQAVMPVPVRE